MRSKTPPAALTQAISPRIRSLGRPIALWATVAAVIAASPGCSVGYLFKSASDQGSPTGRTKVAPYGLPEMTVTEPRVAVVGDEAQIAFQITEQPKACARFDEIEKGPTWLGVLGSLAIDAAIFTGGLVLMLDETDGCLEDSESATCGFGMGGTTAGGLGLVFSSLNFLHIGTYPEGDFLSWKPTGAAVPCEAPAPPRFAVFRYEAELPDGRRVTGFTDERGRASGQDLKVPASVLKTSTRLVVTPPYRRTVTLDLQEALPVMAAQAERYPARLEASATFVDPSGDGALDAGERARVRLVVKNTGRGKAFAQVVASVEGAAPGVTLKAGADSVPLEPGASHTFDIPVDASEAVGDGLARLRLHAREVRGFDADPLVVEVKTRALRSPRLVLAGVRVDDDAAGDSFGNANGVIEPGEQVELELVVQNLGEGRADGVAVALKTRDPALTVSPADALPLGSLAPGAVATVKALLVVTKRYEGSAELPVDFTLRETRGRFGVAGRVPVELRQRPREVAVVRVEATPETGGPVVEADATPEADRPMPFPALPPDPKAWALVVGIETYANAPPSTFAARDAQSFADLITHLGVPRENQRVLLGDQATYGALRASLTWLANHAQDGSRVYVYFAGHGVPDAATQTPYLLPHDGQPAYARETALPVSELQAALARLTAREVVLFMDACFSGVASRDEGESLLADARPLVPVGPSAPPAGARLTQLAAAGANELSSADPGLRHGLFTNYLLLGLRGAADADRDGRVTLTELHAFVSPEVARHARRLNRQQVPQLFGPKGVAIQIGAP